jgi:hypothetical protein
MLCPVFICIFFYYTLHHKGSATYLCILFVFLSLGPKGVSRTRAALVTVRYYHDNAYFARVEILNNKAKGSLLHQ